MSKTMIQNMSINSAPAIRDAVATILEISPDNQLWLISDTYMIEATPEDNPEMIVGDQRVALVIVSLHKYAMTDYTNPDWPEASRVHGAVVDLVHNRIVVPGSTSHHELVVEDFGQFKTLNPTIFKENPSTLSVTTRYVQRSAKGHVKILEGDDKVVTLDLNKTTLHPCYEGVGIRVYRAFGKAWFSTARRLDARGSHWPGRKITFGALYSQNGGHDIDTLFGDDPPEFSDMAYHFFVASTALSSYSIVTRNMVYLVNVLPANGCTSTQSCDLDIPRLQTISDVRTVGKILFPLADATGASISLHFPETGEITADDVTAETAFLDSLPDDIRKSIYLGEPVIAVTEGRVYKIVPRSYLDRCEVLGTDMGNIYRNYLLFLSRTRDPKKMPAVAKDLLFRSNCNLDIAEERHQIAHQIFMACLPRYLHDQCSSFMKTHNDDLRRACTFFQNYWWWLQSDVVDEFFLEPENKSAYNKWRANSFCHIGDNISRDTRRCLDLMRNTDNFHAIITSINNFESKIKILLKKFNSLPEETKNDFSSDQRVHNHIERWSGDNVHLFRLHPVEGKDMIGTAMAIRRYVEPNHHRGVRSGGQKIAMKRSR